MKLYFIVKEGIYEHGVFWIGNDREAGVKKADELAALDRDAHHDWCLYEFIGVQNNPEEDAVHLLEYETRRQVDAQDE